MHEETHLVDCSDTTLPVHTEAIFLPERAFAVEVDLDMRK